MSPSPSSADQRRAQWALNGASWALIAQLEQLWSHRSVVAFGEEPGEKEAIDALWHRSLAIGDASSLSQWLAQVRSLVWETPEPWHPQKAQDLDHERALIACGRRWLGPVIAERLQADDFLPWLKRAEGKIDTEIKLNAWWKHHGGRPADPAPPQEAAVARLCERFGLRRWQRLGSAPEDLASVEQGLSAFAQALGWHDRDVGAGHLALVLSPTYVGQEGLYDALNHAVVVQGSGSFAHEWAHALDFSVGTHRAGFPLAWTHHRACDFPAQRTLSRHERPAQALEVWGAAVFLLKDLAQAPTQELRLQWIDQVASFDHWMARARQAGSPLRDVQRGWDRWCLASEGVIHDAAQKGATRWARRARKVIACLQQWAQGQQEPESPAWVMWARMRDQAEGARYWALPEELWSRSFHAEVCRRLGAKTWVADDAGAPHLFPSGAEATRLSRYWDHALPSFKTLWRSYLLPDWLPSSARPSTVGWRSSAA